MILFAILALAQAPAATPPGPCLTNACSTPLPDRPRNPAAVATAVRAGHYGKTLAAGGTADDILAAARVRCRNAKEADLRVCGEIEPGSMSLSLFQGQPTLAFRPKGADDSRPGDITKVEMILTDEPQSGDREVMDSVLPPPPRP